MLRFLLGFFIFFASIQGFTSEYFEETTNLSSQIPLADFPDVPSPGETPDNDSDEDEKDFEDDFFNHTYTFLNLAPFFNFNSSDITAYKDPFLGNYLRPPRS